MDENKKDTAIHRALRTESLKLTEMWTVFCIPTAARRNTADFSAEFSDRQPSAGPAAPRGGKGRRLWFLCVTRKDCGYV